MGNTPSDVESSDNDVSVGDVDLETCIKLAAIYWTRIAKEEGFQTAFMGATAARVYGSPRVVNHVDVLIEKDFGRSDKLHQVIAKNEHRLHVMENGGIMIKITEKNGVVVKLYSTAEDNWGSLVPASKADRGKYGISALAVSTYSERDIGYDENVPVQFAPNVLISKLDGFMSRPEAEKVEEMQDIDAVMDWMRLYNARFATDYLGLGRKYLSHVKSYLRWCHDSRYTYCDLEVINKWKQLGFPLEDSDALVPPPPVQPVTPAPAPPPPPPPPPYTPFPPFQNPNPWYQWPQPQPVNPPPPQNVVPPFQVPQQPPPFQPYPQNLPFNPYTIPPYSNF